MKAFRPTLLLAHRWFGILAALWLFVAGLTGAIMVFTDEIDHALNPDLFRSSAGEPRSTDALVGAILAGKSRAYVSSIDLPDKPGDVAVAYVKHAGPETGGHDHGATMQVMVDPATATILGERQREDIDLSRRGIMDFIVKLHYSLHLGGVAKWLFGLVALAWAIDHVVAIGLSFPVARKWRECFGIRKKASGTKFVFDMHRAVGLWLAPVTFVLAISSVYLNWGKEFRAVVGTVSPIARIYDAAQPNLTTPDYAPAIGYRQAADIAMGSTGAVDPDGMSFNPAKGLYRVRFFDARDVDPTVGRRYVYVDSATGKVRADEHQASGSAGDLFLAWQFPLHSGKAFGWAGRILIMFAGLVVCLFVVTGLMLWAKKAGARQHSRQRQLSRLAPASPAE